MRQLHITNVCSRGMEKKNYKYSKIHTKMNNNNVKVNLNLLESRFENMSFEGMFKAIYTWNITIMLFYTSRMSLHFLSVTLTPLIKLSQWRITQRAFIECPILRARLGVM